MVAMSPRRQASRSRYSAMRLETMNRVLMALLSLELVFHYWRQGGQLLLHLVMQ